MAGLLSVITSKIEQILQGYLLTEADRQKLLAEISEVIVQDRLTTLATIEQSFAATLATIQGEIHPAASLAGKSIRELQEMARKAGVPYRNLTKPELTHALACSKLRKR